MPKTLVVYYSLDGNTDFIAHKIAEETDSDLLRLRPKKDVNPKGFMKYMWGGKQVMQKRKPELSPFETRPEQYELIFVGTPVWAWNYAPSLRTFFSTEDIRGKKVALFCCHGGGPGKTLENMANELMGNEILGQTDFKEPLKTGKDEAGKKAKGWAREIMDKS